MPARVLSQATATGRNVFSQPLSIFGVPVDREAIFSDHKGSYKQRVEKRQRRLIIKTTFIKFFLQADERIQCLTTAYSPTSAIEQIATGPTFFIFKRAILIFTDRRMLHVPTRFNRSSHGAISQIRYEDCTGMEIKGRSLVVHYADGEEETFLYIGRKEKKRLKAFIQNLPAKAKKGARTQKRTHLCPSCTNPLKKKARYCPSCHLKFNSDWQAILRSVFIPGGGYYYSRYPVMGTITGLFESALVSYLVYKLSSLHQGVPIEFGLLAMLAGVIIIEKMIAGFHAYRLTRHFVPESNDYTLRKK